MRDYSWPVSSNITGTDIVVRGGRFPSAPYVMNERSHHLLSLLLEKEEAQENKEAVEEFPKRHF